MKKLRIAVLMGGSSAEHEVSLRTGGEMLKSLDRARYDILPVVISKAGEWLLPASPDTVLSGQMVQEKVVSPVAAGALAIPERQSIDILSRYADVALLALHGTHGEDGRMQSLLDLAGMPYTGSGHRASALGMHKVSSLKLFAAEGITVPRSLMLEKGEEDGAGRIQAAFAGSRKVVVKPVSQGSSVGVSIVELVSPDADVKLAAALALVFSFDTEALAEEFVAGRELTAGVLEMDGQPQVLPITEIKPAAKYAFFDYEAKYTVGATEEITPAAIPEELAREVSRIALACHRILGCKGYSRTDMIVEERTGRIYVLELNTLPGMTATSLLPQQARAVGIEFPELLAMIIDAALEHRNF